MNRKAILMLSMLLCVGFSLEATPLGALNGDFTAPGNAGVVGCGSGICLLGGNGTNVGIGTSAGPWVGTWTSALGLLLPPTLTISAANAPEDSTKGFAEVSGLLAGTSLLGALVDDTAFFYENTGNSFIPNETYDLKADITSGGLLSATILSNAGVGIALMAGNTVVASSTDGAHLLGLSLLSGNTYLADIQFTTGSTPPAGPIGIRLFNTPSGLAQANLLSDVKFSNVVLTPEPGGILLAGAGLIVIGLIRKRRLAR